MNRSLILAQSVEFYFKIDEFNKKPLSVKICKKKNYILLSFFNSLVKKLAEYFYFDKNV